MKDNRDSMYFPNTGMMPQMGPGMGPGMGQMPGMPGMGMPNISQLENRVASLERQVKRLDARVSRLETPYPTPMPYGAQQQQAPQASFQTTETQEFTYPYQTSMQVM